MGERSENPTAAVTRGRSSADGDGNVWFLQGESNSTIPAKKPVSPEDGKRAQHKSGGASPKDDERTKRSKKNFITRNHPLQPRTTGLSRMMARLRKKADWGVGETRKRTACRKAGAGGRDLRKMQ